MNIFLSEIQEKEIISIITGLNYGRVIDVEIDSNGSIISFLAKPKKLFQKPFGDNEFKFNYSEIEKIGKDVILVRK